MDPLNKVTYFAETDSRGKKVPFGIKSRDRSRHTYVIGKTGMGKSTLLENMAIQDIQNGEGIAFIDPHGKTADLLLEYVPKHRINDVLYFAPFDMEYPVSFNVMEDVGVDKRHLVVNGLMSTFEKIWVDAWSARMAYILNNTLLALLEFPGSTLLGVNRMLADKEYRKRVVDNVSDPSVKAFWIEEFGKYTERFAAEATPAIQNKVGQFTSNPLVRNLIGQSKSTFDIRKMMDEKKILIINLSKGRVGEGNANLIGSMLITKIYLAAMSRADASEKTLGQLPNFYLYVDEFQSFANKSFADILSEARKYKLNLTIAHQYIEQMEEEVRDAVFGNVGTMITFRVGAFDAEVLEKEFAPKFTAEDLVNLGRFQLYLKLMIDEVSSLPFSATSLPSIKRPEISFKDEIIAASRKNFARPRAEVEAEILEWHAPLTSHKGEKPKDAKKVTPLHEKRTDSAASKKTFFRDAPPPRDAVRPEPIRPVAPVLEEKKKNPFEAIKVEKDGSLRVDEKVANKIVATPVESGWGTPPEARSQPIKNELPKEKIIPERGGAVVDKLSERFMSPQAERSSIPLQDHRQKERVSLGNLKHKDSPKKKDNKGPQEGNLSELKKALQSMLKKSAVENGEKKDQSSQTPVTPKIPVPENRSKEENVEIKKEQPREQSVEQSVEQKTVSQSSSSVPPVEEKKPKEIPEDVLRKILDVE